MYDYIEREDGKIARIELPDEDGFWEWLEATYPEAYDLIDEHMVIWDGDVSGWDVTFTEGEDAQLVEWIKDAECRQRFTLTVEEGGNRSQFSMGTFDDALKMAWWIDVHVRAVDAITIEKWVPVDRWTWYCTYKEFYKSREATE